MKPETTAPYDPQPYWRALLSRSLDLRGVSWPDLSLSFNRWQYRARLEAIRRVTPTAAGLRVLDVGAGTGFWVALWQSLGAADVCGVDLTETSVEHLRARFPSQRFSQGDIAQAVPFAGPFDLISAIDVLLHIVDDTAYAQALHNLRTVSKVGTRLVLLEPLAQGRPIRYKPEMNSRARGLDAVQDMLHAAGWRVRSVQPAVWLLSIPIETRPQLVHRLLAGFWRRLERLVQGERRGACVGALLYPLDRALCRLPWGPTAKVLLAEAV